MTNASIEVELARLAERLEAHKELVAAMFDERDKALTEARSVLDKEITHLNELRREVVADREQFVKKELVESQQREAKDALDKSEERLRETIQGIVDRLVLIESEAKVAATEKVAEAKASAFSDNVKVAIVGVIAAGGGAAIARIVFG